MYEVVREGWQWANEQTIKFWWRSGSEAILITDPEDPDRGTGKTCLGGVVGNYHTRTENLFYPAEYEAVTSVSDAGHTDGARSSFCWSLFHVVSKSAGRGQSEGGLSVQFAGGRESTSRQSGAVGAARRRAARRL